MVKLLLAMQVIPVQFRYAAPYMVSRGHQRRKIISLYSFTNVERVSISYCAESVKVIISVKGSAYSYRKIDKMWVKDLVGCNNAV